MDQPMHTSASRRWVFKRLAEISCGSSTDVSPRPDDTWTSMAKMVDRMHADTSASTVELAIAALNSSDFALT